MSKTGEQQQNTSVWLALNNRVFAGLWLASVVFGCCVPAHDTAAEWRFSFPGRREPGKSRDISD
jgi:hypothetical protein